MAAVTVLKARPCSPVAYEVNDKGHLLSDVVAGNLLILTSTGWDKCPTNQVDAHGIALQDGYAGQDGFGIGIQGEMDGYSGLTPGAALYPSGSVAGGIDTTAPTAYAAATTPAVAVPAVTRIRACNLAGTRIRYSFV